MFDVGRSALRSVAISVPFELLGKAEPPADLYPRRKRLSRSFALPVWPLYSSLPRVFSAPAALPSARGLFDVGEAAFVARALTRLPAASSPTSASRLAER